MYMFK